MKNRAKFIGPALSICTLLLFAGCNWLGAKKPNEIAKTPTEQKKAALLKQIDRKFENPQAHFELGQLYQNDGLWAQAEYHYNIALGFDPIHREAQAARVKVLAESGDTAKSELLTDIYMNQAASSAEASLLLGLAFQKQGLDEYALNCYQQALNLQPNSAKINRQIGYYYLSRNDKARALDYLSRSFQLNPNQPEVAGELGRLGVAIRRPTRKTDEPVEKLDKIVERSGNK
jgi:tetratricopeptide (TPR) repeat protein